MSLNSCSIRLKKTQNFLENLLSAMASSYFIYIFLSVHALKEIKFTTGGQRLDNRNSAVLVTIRSVSSGNLLSPREIRAWSKNHT